MMNLDFLSTEPAGLALVLAGAAFVVTLVMALHYTIERKSMAKRLAALEERLRAILVEGGGTRPSSVSVMTAEGERTEAEEFDEEDEILSSGIRFV